ISSECGLLGLGFVDPFEKVTATARSAAGESGDDQGEGKKGGKGCERLHARHRPLSSRTVKDANVRVTRRWRLNRLFFTSTAHLRPHRKQWSVSVVSKRRFDRLLPTPAHSSRARRVPCRSRPTHLQ